ncbi:nucleotide excision repair endonuclease [Halomicrobium sp. HM KBTZ05]|uniref:nucleotide excision repair endonuclease n=1 Tax=Halomicrobium sp. HM KBTZ05 TaxID=3242663 RepID=UPI003557FDA5
MDDLKDVPTTSGVYRLIDLDGDIAYVGRSSNLRSRLRQHFIRQDSSVVSYGRLDIWDIDRIEWWETDQDVQAEKDLIQKFKPYLNFEDGEGLSVESKTIAIDEPDGICQILSDEERKFRERPYNRAKQKIEHLNRMIDKIKLADHSEDTRKTVRKHQEILEEAMDQFLRTD